jgi:hypothetical protein
MAVVSSISVLQWLCNAESSHPTQSPPFRLARFFASLHASLSRGARAVFQFYPQSDDQVNLIMGIAMKSGFGGGLVVDYPNSRKAKKFYLCLITGGASSSGGQREKVDLPRGLTGEPGEESNDRVKYERQRATEANTRGEKGKKRRHPKEAAKDWILRKKEVCRQLCYPHLPSSLSLLELHSYIEREVKRVYLAIQNLLGEDANQYFKPHPFVFQSFLSICKATWCITYSLSCIFSNSPEI